VSGWHLAWVLETGEAERVSGAQRVRKLGIQIVLKFFGLGFVPGVEIQRAQDF
jgi:hypothetical protein